MRSETLLARLADDVQKDLKTLGIDKEQAPANEPKLTQIRQSGVGLISSLNEWETRHAKFKTLTKAAIEDRVTVRPIRALTAAANAANLPLEKLTAALEAARNSGASSDEMIGVLTDLSKQAEQRKAATVVAPPTPVPDPVVPGKPKKSEK